ncbi:hypothetical protein EV21_15150, partial [Staphylococcus aureus]
LYALGLVIRNRLKSIVAAGFFTLFLQSVTLADRLLGLSLLFVAFSLVWFVGILGPSIVLPAIAAITYGNIEANVKLCQVDAHA